MIDFQLTIAIINKNQSNTLSKKLKAETILMQPSRKEWKKRNVFLLRSRCCRELWPPKEPFIGVIVSFTALGYDESRRWQTAAETYYCTWLNTAGRRHLNLKNGSSRQILKPLYCFLGRSFIDMQSFGIYHQCDKNVTFAGFCHHLLSQKWEIFKLWQRKSV